MLRRSALLAVLCVLPGLALAGDGDVEDWSLESLLESVVSESVHQEQAASAPATVTSLTREDVLLSGAATIPDLLRRIPGLQVVETTEMTFTVSARGLGGLQDNNVVLLLDGVPMNTRADGSIRWGTLPVTIQQIERVEVIRGPVSTLYGANASGAVIHIITNPSDPRPVVGASLGGRTPATFHRHLWVSSGGGGDRINWRVNLRGSEARSPDDPAGPQSRGGLGADVTVQYQPSQRLSGYTRLSSTFDSRGGENALISDTARYFESTILMVTGLDWHASGRLESASISGGFASWLTEPARDTPAISLANSDEAVGWLEGSARVATLGEGNLTLAAGFRQDTVEADYLTIPVSGISAWDVRVHMDQPVGDRLLIDAGVRLDYHPLTRLRPTWRASVQYTPADALRLRMTVGNAFRRPTWVETYSRFRDPVDDVILLEGTPDLDPQQTSSVEWAVTVQPSKALWIRPVVWLGSFDNLISQDNNPFVLKSFANVGSSRLVDVGGAELELEWRRDAAFVPRLSASWLRMGEAEDDGQSVGVPEQNPEATTSVGFRGQLGRFRYGVSADWMSGRTYQAAGGLPVRTIRQDLPAQLRLGGQLWVRVLRQVPLNAGVLLETNQPSVRQSPLPGARPLGTRVLLQIEVRE